METSPADLAQQIILNILLNEKPDTIGAVLGAVMARYLHGHQCRPRDPMKEEVMRRDLFDMWQEKVWGLVGILDGQEATKQ